MKKAVSFLISGWCFLSGYVLAQAEKESVSSINLEKAWKVEVPALEGESASCYGTLRVDTDDTIRMIVNSGYTSDMVYTIAPDGKIVRSFVLPSDSVYSVNTFETDGKGALYVGGSGYDGLARAMSVVKVDVATGEVLWSRKIRGAETDMAPMVSTSAITEEGIVVFCSKDDTYPGIRLSAFSSQGEMLLDSIYEIHSDKCIPRGAAIADGKVFVTGETFSNDGMLCCFDLATYGLVWKQITSDLANACQLVRVVDGEIVTGGSASMTGTTGVNAYSADGRWEKRGATQRFVTGFGLEKTGDFWLVGGGVAVNPFAEFFSYPMVSIFDKDMNYTGAYGEPDEWEEDTYIVGSAVLGDGSYLTAVSVEGSLRKVYLNKYSVRVQEKKSQRIDWEQPLVTVCHNQPVALTAEASSGLDVSYFTSDGYNEVYVENDTLKVAPSFVESLPEGGEFDIFAVQQGNAEYMPAEYVVKTVMVKVGDDVGTEKEAESRAGSLVYDGCRTVFADNRGGVAEFTLTDVSGREVFRKTIASGRSEIRLGDYLSGMYIVCLQNAVSREVLKICIR